MKSSSVVSNYRKLPFLDSLLNDKVREAKFYNFKSKNLRSQDNIAIHIHRIISTGNIVLLLFYAWKIQLIDQFFFILNVSQCLIASYP